MIGRKVLEAVIICRNVEKVFVNRQNFVKIVEQTSKMKLFGFVEVSGWLLEGDLWHNVQSLWKPSSWLDWTLFSTCAVWLFEKIEMFNPTIQQLTDLNA